MPRTAKNTANGQAQPKQGAGALSFKEKYRALVWSNPDAPAEVFIRKALLRADFDAILDAAVEFGLPAIQAQWVALEQSGDPEVLRAASTTTRILKNIADGHQQATS